MSVIPDRVWDLLTPSEKAELEAVVDGWRFRPTFRCPTCDTEVAVRLSIKLGAVLPVSEEKTPPQTVVKRTAVDARTIEAARTSGLMDAFVSATKAEKEHSGIPGDMDEFFLSFWKGAQPTIVPRVVLATWIAEFGGAIDVWQYQGVNAVMSNGELMAFFPNRLTIPASVSGHGPRPKVSNAASFELWTKNRWGYVPVSARSFGAALKQRNIGAFGTLVQ